jgi:hypothetical protein
MFIPNCASLYENGEIDIEAIMHEYLGRFHEHELPLNWFNDEVKAVFGIDVFRDRCSDLSDSRIFSYRRDNVDLLIMRTEDIDRIAESAVGGFLGINKFRLQQSNASSEKNYSRVYRDFLKEARLPAEYLKMLYESLYSTFFYSPTEIKNFEARWQNLDPLHTGVL